jgi:antitoxin MazE
MPIPKAFAKHLDLWPDTPVMLVIEGEKLVIVPVTEPVYTLGELLAGVTEENRHKEVDTGAASGREAW